MNEPRYYVYDSQATSFDPKNTAINPRYWVVDRTTNLPVDEYTSKRAAQMAASFETKQDKIHDASTCAICRADVLDYGTWTPADHPKAHF
jgi:hypothetical protein